MSAPVDTLKIAYVTSRWGEPTQTFVRREAAAALAAGSTVVVLSLKAPAGSDTSVPVVHLRGTELAWCAARGIARHPLRSALALGRGVIRGRPRTIAANLAAGVIGIAASARLPQVDWIHAHFNWVAGTAADALATVRGQPYSVFPHAFDLFDERFVDRYTGDKLRRAALVLVESEAIARETNELFACGAVVQRMGVPLMHVADEVRPHEGSLVLSVGSLLPKKGHDDLIRAICDVPEARLRILGEGTQRTALELLAAELGVSGRVELPGAVAATSVMDHLDEADVFCLASKPTADGDRDGVPNVLIEAMARGVPVVSTDVSGIPDLLGPDRGTLVAPGDVDALSEALRDALADPAGAGERARAALVHVRECYTTEVNWQVLAGRIRRVLGSA